MYSDESVGMVHAPSEFVVEDLEGPSDNGIEWIIRAFLTSFETLSAPVYTGNTGVYDSTRQSTQLAAKEEEKIQQIAEAKKVGIIEF